LQTHAQPQKRAAPARARRKQESNIRFASGKSALKIPFDLSGNLILLPVRVNDSEPLWFIFDTGADSTVIDAALVKQLHLSPVGKITGSGSGGSAEAVILKGISLKLPDVEASHRTVAALPLDFLSAPLGRKISGILGNDITKEFVVEIDYAARNINLYEPLSYRYSGAGEIIPIIFEENLPFVRARFVLEGRAAIAGKFELDTGSTGAVLFNTPFVKKHQLLKSISQENQIRIGGVGGTAQAFLGRVKSVALGRFVLENAVARFSQSTRGDYATDKYDGLVGGEILHRFRVVIDYSRRRMMLEPNADFSEPYEADMSGMKLVADGDDFSIVLVDDVEAKSPAAEAGIQGGDTITAIDGRPAQEFTLDQIRRMLMQDGREYLITLKRGEQTVQARLKLKRSI
ncbi:MAG: aspartyl protease family protein, partial [Pyrinomonadaceae bacterium]